MRPIRLIPYGCGAGGKVPGSERAALDLKEQGLAGDLSGASWQADPAQIYDTPMGKRAHDALPDLGTAARKDIVLWHCRALQNEVTKAIAENALPLTLGGDHAMALGSISALARAKNAQGKTGVLWIDAHPDLNTPDTSPSQALHGMPLAALCGMGDLDFIAIAGERPAVDPRHIAYVGIRDIDPGEKKYIEKLGIAAFTMDDVRRLGIADVLKQAKDVITKNTKTCAVSIDLDAFDPAAVPATGSPVPGGLDPDSVLPELAKLAGIFDLVEIAEYNPALPGRDQTIAFIKRLCRALLI